MNKLLEALGKWVMKSGVLDKILSHSWARRHVAHLSWLALGMWIQGTYYKEIRLVLEKIHLTRETWLGTLLAVASVGGAGAAALLAYAKDYREKQDGETSNAGGNCEPTVPKG